MFNLALFLIDLSLSLCKLVFLIFGLSGLLVNFYHQFFAILGLLAELIVEDGQILLQFIGVGLGLIEFAQTS